VGAKLMKHAFLSKVIPFGLAGLIIFFFLASLIYSGSINVSGLQIGAKYTVPLLIICLLVTFGIALYIAATKNNNYWLVTLITFFISIPFFQISLPTIINCYFDDGNSQIIHVKIIDKEVVEYKSTKGGHGYSYNIKLDVSEPYQAFRTLKVSKETYEEFNKNDWIEMDVKPGKLGYPWVRSFRRY
jgi:flagellar biosynthesis protein FliQ